MKTIVLLHDFCKISKVICDGRDETAKFAHVVGKKVTDVFATASIELSCTYLGWCHESLLEYAHFEEWPRLITHPLQLLSFEPSSQHYIDQRIAYVDFGSPFILNIPKAVRFGTWMASACCGIAHATTIHRLSEIFKSTNDFNLALNAVFKCASNMGLFTYSEPKLLNRIPKTNFKQKPSIYATLRLVKSYYGVKWIPFLCFCILIFEHRFRLDWLLYGLFAPSLPSPQFEVTTSQYIVSGQNPDTSVSIEVIIPTLGRSEHLKKVLLDLARQKLKPKTVTIVEQSQENVSELAFINQEAFPFKIKHYLVSTLGACNARNLALDNLEDEVKWVFFADDDIRIEEEALWNAIKIARNYDLPAITLAVFLPDQKVHKNTSPAMWPRFGSGCSLVKAKYAKMVRFDKRFEFGYGEDSDYGIALRKIGCNISYISTNPILHLKAPSGGFRTKFTLPWEGEEPLPKPSPTILLYYLKNFSPYHIHINRLIKEKTLNLSKIRHQWSKSLFWANRLLNNDPN